MRQTITLYIDGNRADCDTATLVQMTYTREELENPTIVRNSYSKNVTLPSTATNDRIFSHYHRNDYRTATGFTPLARVPFLLYGDTGEVLERGYLKLNSVAYTGRFAHSYACTLYGGLGGYFYGLTYNEDGSKKSLADITYKDTTGTRFTPRTTTIALTALAVNEAWKDLHGDSITHYYAKWSNVLNFAPCDNGIPEDFDADKALASYNQYLPLSAVGNHYLPGANSYLLEMSETHTAAEMRDFRTYLQRPVLKIAAFLDALEDAGGFIVTASARSAFANIWVTLPMPPRDKTGAYTSYAMEQLFTDGIGPADLLVSLAKTFGCVFVNDCIEQTITMMTRDEYYNTGLPVIDLSQRVDASKAQSVTPFPFSKRWVAMRNTLKTAFAEEYKNKYGIDYGMQRLDTGYDFNSEEEDIFKDVPLSSVPQVLAASGNMFAMKNGSSAFFAPTATGSVSFKYVNGQDVAEKTMLAPLTYTKTYYNATRNGSDIASRPEFADKDGKTINGAVLLFLEGWTECPNVGTADVWHISDDAPGDYDVLNGGTPCWDVRPTWGQALQRVPHFSRWRNGKNLDFGTPKEVAAPDTQVGGLATIYGMRWERYLQDRYSPDSRVLKCSVNLRGLGTTGDLLRRFFFYEGSIWSLNKISNHSLTTLDTTECEFIRVQDKTNYTNGQFSPFGLAKTTNE